VSIEQLTNRELRARVTAVCVVLRTGIKASDRNEHGLARAAMLASILLLGEDEPEPELPYWDPSKPLPEAENP